MPSQIADRLTELLKRCGIAHFIINLGALTMLHYASEGDSLSVGGIALLIAIVLAGSGGISQVCKSSLSGNILTYSK